MRPASLYAVRVGSHRASRAIRKAVAETRWKHQRNAAFNRNFHLPALKPALHPQRHSAH